MTDPRRDAFEAMRLPETPQVPRTEFARDLCARLHRRAGVAPRFDEVPMAKAVRLEYELAGNPDGEVVLLLHAAGATSYAPLMTEPVLTEGYRLLRCHRRGFAGSDPLDGDATIASHAQDALALLEHLQIDRAHVVGHSSSGVIALQLALEAPGAVRSLALEEPALHAIDPRLLALMSEAAQPLLDLAKSGETTRAMDRWMRGLSRTWRTDIARTVPGGAQQVLEDAEAFFADVDAVLSWRFDRDRVTALDLPVLHVLAGSPRTPLADIVLRRFRDVVPHTESVEIPGASHLLHTDQPVLVATELASFFARHAS